MPIHKIQKYGKSDNRDQTRQVGRGEWGDTLEEINKEKRERIVEMIVNIPNNFITSFIYSYWILLH